MNSPNLPQLESDVAGPLQLPLQPSVDPYFGGSADHSSGPIPFMVQPTATSHTPPCDEPPAIESAEVDLNSVSEPRVDVRMFAQDDGPQSLVKPMPIRSALCGEATRQTEAAVADQHPSTAEPDPSTCQPTSVPFEVTGTHESVQAHIDAIDDLIRQDFEGKFVATPGSVVEIDGNEGYDYIDLSNRDINSVAFVDGNLVVSDATMEQPFTIRYRNVSRVLFANGQMIDLP